MSAIQELKAAYADICAIRAGSSLMNWDRQLFMPPGGAGARSAHLSILSRMSHERLTSQEFLKLLHDSKPESEDDGLMLSALRRELESWLKLPTDLVQRKTQVSSDAYDAWRKAKAASDFSLLAPFLAELIEINREMAERLGYLKHPYDALINLFEYQATTADATAMFGAIKAPIVGLVQQIKEQGKPVDDSLLIGDWSHRKLRAVAQEIASQIGYDFTRGRLDVGYNAFCMNLSCDDVRMTTRPSNHVKGILSSTFHEMGHGLYEQHSPKTWDRTPLAGGVSLAVHESQSRTWENIIGRSLGFWRRFLPTLQAAFPQLSPLEPNAMFRAMNKVQAEPVRVGADELTYNLHILVRFELEVALIEGSLEVKDIPEAWNAKYSEYLGLNVANDAEGSLQDVHWSRGSFGYFPTYSMGNLIGAQIWASLQQDFGDTEGLILDGRFHPIIDWLTTKVYSKGKSLPPRELVIHATGHPVSASDWLSYVDRKYRAIYGL